VMGNLPCGELLGVYRERMKIEEAFRDLKSRLGMVNLMSKTRENAEKTLRLLAFAYALGMVWTYAASTCTGNRGLKSRLSLPAMSLRRHW
jgi:hypothetical protein